MSRAVLEPYLRQGGLALVVFDGLDEIFDTAVREQVIRQIEAFAGRYPQVRVLVTTRVVGYRRATLDAAGIPTGCCSGRFAWLLELWGA